MKYLLAREIELTATILLQESYNKATRTLQENYQQITM